ncbi:MAG: lactate utilization protein [Verrucomicrobiota bacterium]|nr:lactate utilization protein [Verrucomicrobiota bacterium]
MPRTTELNDWTTEKKCRRLVENLARKHFTAVYCATAQEAADYILKEAEGAASVGFGGSLSVADLKLTTPLAEKGKEILNHGFPDLTPEQRVEIMKRQQTCDLFLTGTNAVTLDGCLVNIDGNGNRVAAMIYGPGKVIVVAGRNKIVEGDVCDAIRRVKDKASPPNAQRLGKQTPCAATGFCHDCDSPQRICHVTTVIDSKPSLTDLHVLVVNEDMGL